MKPDPFPAHFKSNVLSLREYVDTLLATVATHRSINGDCRVAMATDRGDVVSYFECLASERVNLDQIKRNWKQEETKKENNDLGDIEADTRCQARQLNPDGLDEAGKKDFSHQKVGSTWRMIVHLHLHLFDCFVVGTGTPLMVAKLKQEEKI